MKFLIFGYLLALLTSMAGMEIFSVLIVLTTLFFLVTGRYTFKFSKLTVGIILLFFLSHILSIILSPYIQSTDFIDYLRKARWILYLFIIPIFLKENVENIVKYRRVFLWLLLLVSIYSLVQVFSGVDFFRKTSYYKFQEIYSITLWRAKGFYTNTMTYSYIMGIILSFLFPFVLRNWRSDKLLSISYGLTLISFFLGFTRGAWLALVVTFVLIILLFYRHLVKKTLVCLISGALILLLIPGMQARVLSILNPEDLSRLHRLNIWKANVEMFKDNFYTGVGLNQNTDLTPRYFDKLGIVQDFYGHGHNSFIQYLSTTGIIGFFTLILFTIYFLVVTFKCIESHANFKEQQILIGLMSAQIFFILGGLTEALIIDAEILHWYSLTISSIIYLKHRKEYVQP